MVKNGELFCDKFGSTQLAGYWPMCYLIERLNAAEVKWSNCCITEMVRTKAVNFFIVDRRTKSFSFPKKVC